MVFFAYTNGHHVVHIAAIYQVVLGLCFSVAGAGLINRNGVPLTDLPHLTLLVVIHGQERVPAVLIDVKEPLRCLVAHTFSNCGLNDPDAM
ncbi:hypothetical protein D3C76_1531650 [compost metagenome]